MRQTNGWIVMIALAALVAAGCGPENGGNSNNASNNGADAGDVEGGDAGDGGNGDGGDTDMSDAGDTEDDGDGETCEPITECGADQCGTIDDGCGGTLECATACPCQGGEAQEETCGSCGLGLLECGADEDGFGTCVTPPISEDLACEDVLYVNSSAGSDGDGSTSAPFASYTSAFAAASDGQTIIVGGSAPLETMIEVKDGVSVIGGYDVEGETWTFNPEKQQTVQVPAGSTDTFGLAAIELVEETVVYGLDITTADAADGGSYNNYGAYVARTDTLTLEFVDVFAGRGGAGADGTPGAAGADGEDGEDAAKATSGCIFVGCPASEGPGAAAGVNQACPDANGGAGGSGGRGDSNQTFEVAADGVDASDALGGRGGIDSVGQRGGESGNDGPDILELAESGDATQPGGTINDSGYWEPSGAGENGASGRYGSGGGGGGGSAHNSSPPDGSLYRSGPGGAGGGAGGCGGDGGQGGQPGGGSFGLFSVESDITLIGARFNASAGGVGGAGAAGGNGGLGGTGGDGSNQLERYSNANSSETVTLSYFSGNGGDGSNGQTGGAGAGGAGGVSYGAYCKQSRLEQTDVEFSEGAVASGGASPGADGLDGLAVEIEGCQ